MMRAGAWPEVPGRHRRGIKTARLGGTWAEAAPDEREAVGRVLTEVFGPVERVEL